MSGKGDPVLDTKCSVIDTHLREVVNDLVCALQRQSSLVLQAFGGVDPYGKTLPVVLPPGEILHVLEVTKRPC